MTSSSPSILPVPGGAGSADVSSTAVPHRDDPGLRFDDLCPDESASRCQSRPDKPRPDAVSPPVRKDTDTNDLDTPIEGDVATETGSVVEPPAENVGVVSESATEPVSEDDADAVEQPDPLVIALSRADMHNPAKLLAAIADVIAQQAGTGGPGELQLVLQPPSGSQAAETATNTVVVPIRESAQLLEKRQGHGSGRAVAATIAAVVRAALSYARESGGAKGPTAANPGASVPAESSKPVAVLTARPSSSEGENTSASNPKPAGTGVDPSNENFLPIQHQRSIANQVRAGTDGALQGENMNSAPRQILNRLAAHHAAMRGGLAATEDASGGMKGWTNSSGEQEFTNSRFSHLSERVAGTMANQPAPAAPVPAATSSVAPMAPVVPAFPVSESALLGPLGNALERMVLRGQEQLSLTIRFEQGGSLALRLALQNGEIKTQIHTDVAGLENALRSAWSAFSQDWSNRGVKLAAPVFSTSPDTTPDQHHSTTRHHAGSEFEGAEGFSRFRGSSRLGGATRDPRARPTVPDTPVSSSRSHQRGLHVWA